MKIKIQSCYCSPLPRSLSFSPPHLININQRPRVETQAINNAALQNASSQIIGATGQVLETAWKVLQLRCHCLFLNKYHFHTEQKQSGRNLFGCQLCYDDYVVNVSKLV